MWVKLTNRIALCWLLLVIGNTALAESNAKEAIDFDQAIARTLESNPALI